MHDGAPWGLMLVCGLLTFLIRYSFIGALGSRPMPDWFLAILPLVPVSALTALVTPELFLLAGDVVLGVENARLWAGVVAIAVAALWRNTLLTIGVGFMVFALLRLVL